MSNANKYPHMQPFQLGNGRKNLTKKNAWFQKFPPQNNTQSKKS